MSEVHNDNAQYMCFWGPQTALGAIMHLQETTADYLRKMAARYNKQPPEGESNAGS